MELLTLRKDMTITKDMFLNHLYGGMDEPEGKIIDVFICKLRKKLASASGGDEFIETVWGRVLGDGVLAVDPGDHAGWLNALERVLTDEALQKRMRKAALVAASRLSWQNSARQLLSVFDEVGRNGASA